MKEKELKIPVDSHDKIKARLAGLGAEFLCHVTQKDDFYDTPDGCVMNGDSCLRLRHVVHLDGAADDEYFLTWKGPREDVWAKVRPEYETAVSSPAAVGKILNSLGYEKTFEVVKKRTSYRLGCCRIELDELDRLGFFVEIEGPDEAELEKTRKLLQIEGHEPRSYASLLRQAIKKTKNS